GGSAWCARKSTELVSMSRVFAMPDLVRIVVTRTANGPGVEVWSSGRWEFASTTRVKNGWTEPLATPKSYGSRHKSGANEPMTFPSGRAAPTARSGSAEQGKQQHGRIHPGRSSSHRGTGTGRRPP